MAASQVNWLEVMWVALGAVMVVVELVRPSFKIKKRLKKIRHFARLSRRPDFVGVTEDSRNRFYDRYAHPLTTAMPTPYDRYAHPLNQDCGTLRSVFWTWTLSSWSILQEARISALTSSSRAERSLLR